MKPLGFALNEMPDLLEVRDGLRRGRLTGAEKAAAVGRLAMYAVAGWPKVKPQRGSWRRRRPSWTVSLADTAQFTAPPRRSQ